MSLSSEVASLKKISALGASACVMFACKAPAQMIQNLADIVDCKDGGRNIAQHPRDKICQP